MSRIRLLPETLANQIAAGEVVQRPASVVKELLENAIDAGATDIKLIVKDGGKTLIQVVDNGMGMDEVDARMSFERHATSKISSSEDLFRIMTKGFRGEALASIAAVSHVEMRTRPENADLGTLLRLEGGKVVGQEPVATPKGTSVAVKNLFFNVPARRKFLKSAQVEMRHVTDEFQRVALAHPEIAFTLIHNGNEVYRLPPAKPLQRIGHIFGRKMIDRLVPVNEQTDYVRIHGYTGKPEFAKQRRGEQFFFVNRRFVKSGYLHSAVMQAYEGLLPEKRYPPYFIFFDIDPGHIDINIHPTKTEIKFDDEYTVYNLLRASVRHALGKFDQMPGIDFDLDPELIPRKRQDAGKLHTPQVKVNPDFNPFRDENATPFLQEPKAQIPSPTSREDKADQWQALQELFSAENDGAQQETPSFQWQRKYIVTQTREGLMIVHQHRAHKSVLFHRLQAQMQAGDLPMQQLMFPEVWEYLPEEIRLLEKNLDALARTGIEASIENGTLVVQAIPAHATVAQIKEYVEELLAHWAEDIPLESGQLEKFMLLSLAEKTAIRSGQELGASEQQQLLAELLALPEPRFDPSGKPNFVIIPAEQIDRQF